MLGGIFGSASAEKTLLFLGRYEEGQVPAIARTPGGLSYVEALEASLTRLAAALASLVLLGSTCEPADAQRVHVTVGDSISDSRIGALELVTGCHVADFAIGGTGCSQLRNALPFLTPDLAALPADGTVWLSTGIADWNFGASPQNVAACWDDVVSQILGIQPAWNVVALRYLDSCRVEIWDHVTMTDDPRVTLWDPWWLGTTSDGCHPTEESQYERTTWAIAQSNTEVCW